MAESFPPAPGGSSGSFPQGHEPRDDAPTQSADVLLFRRYRVIRELGRGGMGVVLLAHDTALDIDVAVKLVPDLVVKDTEAINDLRKEVLRGMALNHDGIVRTHNFERDESGAGIVMECVEGDTLTDLKMRQPGGCFDPEQILPWIEQLCAVLDYAHREARIIHRDLKPRNIMLTKSGRVKVADFGIAAVLTDSTSKHSMEGKISGTMCYMSPQQAEGKRPSHLDDIHAFGATIYELLTSKPPFFRGNQAVIHAQILSLVPPTMSERREELEVTGHTPIPPVWEETIAACLAKDPAARPQSAGEVFARLRNTSSRSADVEVCTASASPPAQRPTRSRVSLAWGMAVAFGVAGAAYYFAGERAGERHAVTPPSSASPHPARTPAPMPSPPALTAQQLLAEARVLRENEAPQLANDRLHAGLVLEPNNGDVLAELAALRAMVTPAPVVSATPAPATPPPAPAIPAASIALIRRVTASSVLPSQVDDAGRTNSYAARNTIDGKLSTAWVAVRGAKEVWLRVEFEREVAVSRFALFPGYGKDADAFAKNNRVKAFALEFPGGRTFPFRCVDRREEQHFLLPEPVTATTFTFRVFEVFRGGKFDGDTPISEIGF